MLGLASNKLYFDLEWKSLMLKKKWYVTTELILEKKSECFKKKQKQSKATI